jgi:helix-turn-helix domain of resolvase
MLSMSDINHIRDLYQGGYKISEIHKKTGADPKTIKKYLEKEDFFGQASYGFAKGIHS